MSIRINTLKVYDGEARTGYGANSADFSSADAFVAKSGKVVSKATSSTPIVGVSQTRKTYTSNNETVAKAALDFLPVETNTRYEVTITGGSVTAASEESYFNLSDEVTVDGSTASTTTGQLQLVKYVSATMGVFTVVNK
jgi:hypothetical protein